jgi:hypothetical protein
MNGDHQMRGLFGVLLLAFVAIVAGLIGYQAGISSNAVAAGTAVVVTGGFPGFGFLFFLFFIGFLFFAFAGRRRGPWGHGYGHGGWGGRMGGGPGGPGGSGGPGDSSDPRRQWVADIHRSLHAEDAAAGGSTNTRPSTDQSS